LIDQVGSEGFCGWGVMDHHHPDRLIDNLRLRERLELQILDCEE